MPQSAHVRTSVLDIAYEQDGPAEALPVVLLQRTLLSRRGRSMRWCPSSLPRVIARWFRLCAAMAEHASCRPTRRAPASRPPWGRISWSSLTRSTFDRPCLAGFDWGARAACVVSALWPERARPRDLRRLSGPGYRRLRKPVEPEQEPRFWYQYHFQTERGRRGLGKTGPSLGGCYGKALVADVEFRRGDLSPDRCIVRE